MNAPLTPLQELMAEGVIVEEACKYGRMAFLRTDLYMAQSLGIYREFSESEIDVWRHFVRPGDTVVSAGANTGAHIVWLAQAVGKGGRVITCEPQSLMHDIVRHNLDINDLHNVELHRLAIGDRGGNANIPKPDYRWPNNFGSAALVDSLTGTEKVEVATIDQLVGTRNVRMIHLDVEGHEAKALAGAWQTIERCKPVLYVEIDREDQRNTVLKMLAGMRYEALQHFGPLYNPDNHAKVATNVFGTTCSINVLGLPRAEA